MTYETLIGLTILAVAGASGAQEFSTRQLVVASDDASWRESPVRLANGDIALVERDEIGDDYRRLRFSENGQFRGELAFSGERRLLALENGEYLSLRNPSRVGACELAGLSTELVMKWRHVDLVEDDDEFENDACGLFSLDATGLLWYADADWIVGQLAADGTPGPTRDLRDVLAPDSYAQVSALAAMRDRSGAYYAFADAFDGSDGELIAFADDFSLSWRRELTAPLGRVLEIDALHALASGAVFGIGISHDAGADDGRLHVIRYGADGTQQLTRRIEPLAAGAIQLTQRFPDGTFGVLYRRPHSSGGETRVAVLDAEGNVLQDHGAGTMSLQTDRHTRFVQLGDGSRWLFTNRLDAEGPIGVALAIDAGGGWRELAVGRQTGTFERSDGDVLVFGDALGDAALRFDGSDARILVGFDAPTALGDRLLPGATRHLGDGELLLWTDVAGRLALARIDATGHSLWRVTLEGRRDDSSSLRTASLMLLLDDHVCIPTTSEAAAFALECRALGDGAAAPVIRLPVEQTTRAFLIESTTGIEILHDDETGHSHYRRVGHGATLAAHRDFGIAAASFLATGYALARAADGATIEMPGPDSALVVHPVDVGAQPLDSDILLRVGNDVIGARRIADPARFELRRTTLAGNVLWERMLDGVNLPESDAVVAQSGPVLQLVLWGIGGRELHRFSVEDGEPTMAPLSISPLSDPSIHAIDPQSGRFHAAITRAGRIDLRSVALDGSVSATGSWRCPGSCEARSISADGRNLIAFVGDTYTDANLLEVALPELAPARRAPVPDDGAIAGVFIATNDTNRGYVIDWLPSARVLFVARFAGDGSATTTRELLDWETMQGVVAAGTETITLPRYRNSGGRFATNDDAPIGAFGSATFRFDGCDRAELVLTDTSGVIHTTEVVQLRRSGPRLKVCNLLAGGSEPAQANVAARGGFDSRQSGAWVATGASDQGLLAAVLPASATTNGVFFAPWFTYWPDANTNPDTGNRHWLTLQGTLTPATSGSLVLTIYRATAGSYGPIRPSNTYRVGTAIWTVVDCEHATLSYRFDSEELAHPYAGRSGVLSYARPGACSGGP